MVIRNIGCRDPLSTVMCAMVRHNERYGSSPEESKNTLNMYSVNAFPSATNRISRLLASEMFHTIRSCNLLDRILQLVLVDYRICAHGRQRMHTCNRAAMSLGSTPQNHPSCKAPCRESELYARDECHSRRLTMAVQHGRGGSTDNPCWSISLSRKVERAFAE